MISTQLLREFVDAGLRKLALDVAHVRSQLVARLQFDVVPVTPTIIQGALGLHQTRSLAFYDAIDRKSTRLNSSHIPLSRMPSSA